MKIISRLFILCLLGGWPNVVKSECIDERKGHFCADHVQSCHLLDEHHDFVTKFCKKTCGICQSDGPNAMVFDEIMVVGELDKSVELACGYSPASASINGCSWINPKGETIQVTDVEAKMKAGYRLTSNRKLNQCGIVIDKIKREDIGKWTCMISIQGGHLEGRKEITLEKRGGCPEDYRNNLVNGYCYYVSFDGFSWVDAKAACKLRGHTLAYPSSKKQVDALVKQLKRLGQPYDFWVDASNLNGKSYNWSSGGPPVTEGWGRGRPFSNDPGRCVTIRYVYDRPNVDDGLEDKECTDKRQFICESAPINYDCPESLGYFRPQYSQQCFKLYDKPQRSWLNAKKLCESKGMVLAQPENEVVQQLQRYVHDKICGTDEFCFEGIWLGASCMGLDCEMVWERDGSKLHESHPLWAKIGPFSIQTDGDCLEMYSSGSPSYHTRECGEKRPTVCEKIGLAHFFQN